MLAWQGHTRPQMESAGTCDACRASLERAASSSKRAETRSVNPGTEDDVPLAGRAIRAAVQSIVVVVIDRSAVESRSCRAHIRTARLAIRLTAVGRAAFDSATAERLAASGDPVILVRPDTSTADVTGFAASASIVTASAACAVRPPTVARHTRDDASNELHWGLRICNRPKTRVTMATSYGR
jgi:hypothetical protein